MADALGEYLRRVIVGDLPSESIAIELAEYDEGWPAQYEEHRRRVAEALGPIALSIEHIGSTAVPGLVAKPIVDVLVTVEDPDQDSKFCPQLTEAGYTLRVREPGHRMFRWVPHEANVHVWATGSEEVRRYLAFRDRLRASPADRDLYAARKRELATRKWPTFDHYAEAKSAVIEQILRRAG